jgi:hypothetical protein
MNQSMSMASWYLHKADQCGKLAKDATHPDCRARYETEHSLWLAIAASIRRDEEKQPEPK